MSNTGNNSIKISLYTSNIELQCKNISTTRDFNNKYHNIKLKKDSYALLTLLI